MRLWEEAAIGEGVVRVISVASVFLTIVPLGLAILVTVTVGISLGLIVGRHRQLMRTLTGAGTALLLLLAFPAVAQEPPNEPFPWTYTGTGSISSVVRTDFGVQDRYEKTSEFDLEITLQPDGTVNAVFLSRSLKAAAADCSEPPNLGRLWEYDVVPVPHELTGTHSYGRFSLSFFSSTPLEGTYTPSTIVGAGDFSRSSTACDDVIGTDGASLDGIGSRHETWTRSFALDRTSPPAPVANSTTISPQDDTTATSTSPTTSEEWGIIERDGTLQLSPPPGGTLNISRSDLPAWARDQIVTVGGGVVRVGAPTWIVTGDDRVLIDGQPIARVGDATATGGVIVEGSDTIFVNGEPVAVIGSYVVDPMVTVLVPGVGGPITSNGRCAGQGADPMMRGTLREGTRFFIGEGDCAVEYPEPIRLLDSPAEQGDTVLQVDGEPFDVGDVLVVGDDPETSEIARVVDKGSLVLEQPLLLDHPADTPVTRVPAEHADQVVEAQAQAIAQGEGSPWVTLVLGAAALLFIGTGLYAWRRFGPDKPETRSMPPRPATAPPSHPSAPLPPPSPPSLDPAPPQPAQPASSERQGNSWLPSIIALVALAGGLIGWIAIQSPNDAELSREHAVFLESVGVVGEAFTPSLLAVTSRDEQGPPTTLTLESGAKVAVVKGSDEMNYGAARGASACDSEALLTYLDRDPALSGAWAQAQGIQTAQVEGFVRDLTPMVLMQDTRLTTYALLDGSPVARQALLQRGTLVLVAPTSEPRVRCASGSPLNLPVPISTPTYVGVAWPGFDPADVVEIEPCDEPLTQFVLRDTATGESFVRPIGVGATSDTDATVEAAGAVTTTVAPTTTSLVTTTTLATTTTATTTTTLPVADHDVTAEGTVVASSRLCGSYAASKAIDGDVTTSWISSSGEGGLSTFQWTGAQDEFIGSVSLISNAANARRSTDHGFAAVTIRVLDASGGAVFETRVELPGTPDPDVLVHPNVVGRSVLLLLEGHENPSGSGFAELTVMVARGTG